MQVIRPVWIKLDAVQGPSFGFFLFFFFSSFYPVLFLLIRPPSELGKESDRSSQTPGLTWPVRASKHSNKSTEVKKRKRKRKKVSECSVPYASEILTS